MDFENRTALVAGARSGIGRAAALQLARRGATVVVVAHSQESAEKTAAAVVEAGGTAVPMAAELSEPDAVE